MSDGSNPPPTRRSLFLSCPLFDHQAKEGTDDSAGNSSDDGHESDLSNVSQVLMCVFHVCNKFNAWQGNAHPDGDRELYLWSLSSQAGCIVYIYISQQQSQPLAGDLALNPPSPKPDEVNRFGKYSTRGFFFWPTAGPRMIMSGEI
jgi:hypothetical protein